MNHPPIFEKDTKVLEVNEWGRQLIGDPWLNKGMAFSEREREEFGLFGLLPPHVDSLEDQTVRAYKAVANKSSDLEKYIYLQRLQSTNITLFHKLLGEHLLELMPIVYTPTVGLGCQKFSEIYRSSAGVFIAYPYRHHLDEILADARFDSVEVIVVTDGERILGLGDQGAGGMGIPIGKLTLYCACAGIHPASTLPILLDTGTNNPDLINDPLYIGWRHERVRGADYDNFIDAFVKAIRKRFPKVLLQFEDFSKQNATPILERYRDELCAFNDDIQGTAAVATGALLAAVNVTGVSLCEQRIVVVGGGSAGCGISALMQQAMVNAGLSSSEAQSRFYLLDRSGLLTEDRSDLLPFQRPFAQARANLVNWRCQSLREVSLLEVMSYVKPTVLIGVSGQANIFTKAVVQEMAKHAPRPVIFPLSNPTSQSEAKPSDLMEWTSGAAVLGTGSPFGPIVKNGASFRVDQTNNAYIFPGMGLGIIAVQARHVSEKMFMAAALALANCSPARQNPDANLLPPLSQIREVSFEVALATAKQAILEGLAPSYSDAVVSQKIREKMWTPLYLPYKRMAQRTKA